MYAHVTTYRLGTSAETDPEIEHALESGEPVSDQAARTIASWWHAPSPNCAAITALSHGLPFDTEDLAREIEREVTEPAHRNALAAWLIALETLLTD